MFKEEFEAVAKTAGNKVSFLKKNPAGYFILSMLAGMYVGFGVLLAFTSGGLLGSTPGAKLVMGMTFSAALSLVIFAGSELFTGNNFVMTAGVLKKTVTPGQTLLLWAVCYLGNAAGSLLLAVLYTLTGLGNGAAGETMAAAAAAKMSAGPVQLIVRGMLCNMLVCAAVWCGTRCKSESGKLIMIFWAITVFFTSGFEHSVANMTLLPIALFNPCGQAVSAGGMLYNLLFVTIGNMIGGIVLFTLPYFAAQKN
ncbi:MAG: formate/nitrite transporter family protein [Lachnospiraceae bacterium]|nr:formate/nitrite transporter family protein [Lachnospiraceae bacterium]